MRLQELPDNLAELIGKVTPEAREALAQVFLQASADRDVEPASFDEDVQRIVVWTARHLAGSHQRLNDAALRTQIVHAVASSKAELRALMERLAAVIVLDPELVDETPFASEEIGRIGRYLPALRELDRELDQVAAELNRRARRPRSAMAVFLVACKIWKSRFHCAPPFSSDTKSPLFNAIERVALDMDSKARSAFSFAAFKHAHHRYK